MNKHPDKPAVPHVDATYFLTRDSNCAGELSCSVDIWYRPPIRCRLTFDRGFVWMPSSPKNEEQKARKDLGLYGAYTADKAKRMFKTIPETDAECIRVDTNVPCE